MSRRGRSRSNYSNSSAYPYRGNDQNPRHGQHDNRFGQDNESGEHNYNSNRYSGGDYKSRGRNRGYRGGGRYMGRSRGGRNSGRSRNRGGGGRYHRHNAMRSSGDSRNVYIDDEDVDMDGGGKSRARPSPYDRPDRRPTNSHYQQIGPQWSIITVLQGAALDQDWLLNEIQRESMVQFTPVQYHIDGENCSFCIEDEKIAYAIRNCSKKISSVEGCKLTILRGKCAPPIMNDQLLVLKKVLSDRYNTETLHLNSSNLFNDPKLKEDKITVRISTSRDMHTLINIISDHIAGLLSLDLSDNRLFNLTQLKLLVQRTPRLKCLNLSKNSLKHMREVDNIKEWNLTELTLDGNPLCAHYKEQSDYVTAVRDRFPDLLVLDDQKLPPPVKFDLEKDKKLPSPVPNHIPESATHIIGKFVKQYFSLYDVNRADLVAAYHEECKFSLTIPQYSRGPQFSSYYAHSRNLMRIKNPSNKISLLKTSHLHVVDLLKQLPKSEHDISGFSVAVPLATPTLLKIIIEGFFREKSERQAKPIIRSFTRVFLCLTDGSRLSIINEHLHIKNPNRSELKTAFSKPPITPSPSPVPEAPVSAVASSVPPNRADLVASFSKDSGMNVSFSEQCLSEHGWDYHKAAQVFLQLKEQGKIPPEAFLQ